MWRLEDTEPGSASEANPSCSFIDLLGGAERGEAAGAGWPGRCKAGHTRLAGRDLQRGNLRRDCQMTCGG